MAEVRQRLEVVFVPMIREAPIYGLDGKILHDLDDSRKHLKPDGVNTYVPLKEVLEWNFLEHRIVLGETWSFKGKHYSSFHRKLNLVFWNGGTFWRILPRLVVSVKDLNSGKVLYTKTSNKR